MSIPARKSKIELKNAMMKTWDTQSYLIFNCFVLIHILFQMKTQLICLKYVDISNILNKDQTSAVWH